MADDDIGREPMLEMYLFESSQLTEQLEEIILRCEKEAHFTEEAINEIFRIMHTIKGSSAMMLFNDVSRLAHSLEDLFFFIRKNPNIQINYDAISDLVLTGLDFIKEETGKIASGEKADGVADGLITNNKAFLETMKAGSNSYETPIAPKEEKQPMYYISAYPAKGVPDSQKYTVRIFFEEDCQMENVRAYMIVHNLKECVSELYHIPPEIVDKPESAEIIHDNGFLLCFATTAPQGEIESLLSQTAFMRKIELNLVDHYPPEITALIEPKPVIQLDDRISEEPEKPQKAAKTVPVSQGDRSEKEGTARQQNMISVAVNKLDMLMDIVGEIVISEAMVIKNPDLAGLSLDHFNKAARQLRKLTDELQDVVMSIRMVPVSLVFHKMNRIVRDMSKRLGKDVDLEILGETTEVDKNIIDHLSDPLMHLIRNAMDHGLENPAERLAAGKNEQGRLTLEAKNVGGEVWIMVRDDGKGMSREKILKKAKEQGLINRPDQEMSDKEVFSLILLPGFSTKEQVTEFSGRGVGMDVVTKNIEKIGGSITIESEFGRGSEITVKIPLTLAIINGIEIGVGKARYTIATTAIKESFRPDPDAVICDASGHELIMIRGQCYPVLRLHSLFNRHDGLTELTEGIMIMIENDTKAACLFADKLIGEQQVVVKALPRYLKKVRGIAGCTILGDGGISLILDSNEILTEYLT
ncbi:MAG: chemotaxis protein CheA [Sporomusaceae bacterium]|nr:chemotaxis protein CheA [Sporomusaceae bacterium]